MNSDTFLLHKPQQRLAIRLFQCDEMAQHQHHAVVYQHPFGMALTPHGLQPIQAGLQRRQQLLQFGAQHRAMTQQRRRLALLLQRLVCMPLLAAATGAKV